MGIMTEPGLPLTREAYKVQRPFDSGVDGVLIPGDFLSLDTGRICQANVNLP